MKNSIILLPVITIMILSFSFQNVVASIESQLAGKIDFVVAADGSGDFKKVQEAIDAIPEDNTTGKVIFLKKGTYKEKIIVPFKKPYITIVGEKAEECIITFDDHSSNTVAENTFTSYTFRADAPDFAAMNITLQNTSKTGQAVALHANGDRQMYLHCRLLGWQDTYFCNIRSRHYLKDCHIEGETDFIFGFGTDLYDSCLIKELSSGKPITAAASALNRRFGYVFKNCKFTSSGVAFNLGRPWWNYAKVVILTSEEDAKLASGGWTGNKEREKTGFYREYKCTGDGFKPSSRVSWAGQLTDEEAKSYELDTIFSHLSFPQGEEAATAEINWILDRWTNPPTDAYMIAIARDVLKCGRDTFPPVPTDDWRPGLDTNSIWGVIKGNIPGYLFTGQFIPVQKKAPVAPARHHSIRLSDSFDNRIALTIQTENPGNITLSIFNVLGKIVLTREFRSLSLGENTFLFDASALQQGIYIYQANVNGILSQGKIEKLH